MDVLVLDGAQRASLVAVRTLGKDGLAVAAVDGAADAPSLSSRWCKVAKVVPDVALSQGAYVRALLDICTAHQVRAVLLAHDGSLEALRRHRADFERVVGLAIAPEQALAVAVDKTRTLAVAEELGLRAPRGRQVAAVEDANDAIDEAGLPAVVKPARSWVQGEGKGHRLLAVVVSSREEALRAIEEMLADGVEAVVQEWLPGDREAVSLMHAKGRIWARFAQRADRTFPPLGGNSVLRESIPLPDDIAPGAERLVLELGLDGYSEVEFRRDAHGRPALMEINPRLSASVEIAVRAGVPFPRLLYRWASGEQLQEQDGYRSGLRMRWLGGDLSWLRSVLGQPPGPDVPSRGRALKAFAAEFAHPAHYDYIDPSDPKPVLTAASGATRRARRLARGGGAAGGLDTDVAVIGAGPYGLSVSAQLSGRGVRHEIFGETMELWRSHMPAGMHLKSEGFASNLSDPAGEYTLERFCAESGIEYGEVAVPIRLDTFSRYGCWFQERMVPQVRRERIVDVRRDGDGFELSLDSGQTLRAGSVVVASGMTSCAYLPPALRELEPHVFHAYEHRDPSDSRGQRVAVVGAGQSALESAALMAEQGADVHVIARAGKLAWNARPVSGRRSLREQWEYPRSGLGDGKSQRAYSDFPLAFHFAPETQRRRHAYTALGPAGAWWLRSRIEGKVQLRLERSVAQVERSNGHVRLLLESPRDGEREELEVSQVVAGTGYRPDVNRLEFLVPQLRGSVANVGGTPVLDRHFQSSVPGLYFVGYLAGLSFGPVMRFVFGADFAARRLARRLAG